MSLSLAKSLTSAAVLAIALVGCTTPPPAPVVVNFPPPVITESPVENWLAWQAIVTAMSPEQLATSLATPAQPESTDELFYYGLLKQGTQRYDDWVFARDIFRQLRENEGLPAEQQQLAGIFEEYNQARINAYHRHEELQLEHEALQEQLSEIQQQNALQEEQIKAITDLEATISTRKED